MANLRHNPAEIVENFAKLKSTPSVAEKFGVTITGIPSGTSYDGGVPPNFVLDVAQGTTGSLVRQYPGIVGRQNLNLIVVNPTWQTDGQSDVLSGGAGQFDSNSAAGTVDFTDQTIVIGQDFFQIKINPNALDNTIYGLQQAGTNEPTMAATAEIIESARAQTKNRIGANFFSGFGASSNNNGLNDVSFTDVGTSAAISATTILARMQEMHAALVADTNDYASRPDNVILLSPTHYMWYKNALIGTAAANWGASLALEESLGAEAGDISSMPFLYDTRIKVISDPQYSGQPKLFQLDLVVFGYNSQSGNEDVDFWYSQDNRTYFLRSVIYGGVTALDTTSFYQPNTP